MSAAPRVSIIVPTRGRAQYLREALGSIRAQTFAAWECIVADDDGTRETAETIRACSEGDPRFRHLLVGARGGSPARVRNVALESVTTELVAFLDDDDRFRSDKLAIQVALLDESPNAVLCCGRVQEFGARTSIWPSAPLPSVLGIELLLAGNEVATSTVLARRAVLGAGFDDRFRMAEDYALWLRVAERGEVRFLDRVLTDYRVHDGNISARELDMLRWVERVIGEYVERYPDPVRPRLGELRKRLREPWYLRWKTLLG